jgi:ribosomal protein S18 acetylase RimI-like enzyme
VSVPVRPAAPADLPLLTDWALDLFAHFRASGDPYFSGTELSRDAARAIVAAGFEPGGLLLVAEHEGVPAGFLQGRIERNFVTESPIREVGHIALVHVRLELRRRGIARALVAAAERRFGALGLAYVELRYLAANRLAAEAWAGLGYEPCRIQARKRLA